MKKIVIGNQKMNLEIEEINDFIRKIRVYENNSIDLIICPSNIYLERFIKCQSFPIGCQNISEHDNGSFTGEVSCSQVKQIGCKYTIIGHSERRKYFYEDNHTINKKIKKSIDNNLNPILCVGETKKQRENNEVTRVLSKQLDEALVNIREVDMENVIIAYEPVWAIGSGTIPTIKEIEDISKFIKKYLDTSYNIDIKVLYGGSVDVKNIEEILNVSSIDGVLVGGVSTNIERFISLLDKIR